MNSPTTVQDELDELHRAFDKVRAETYGLEDEDCQTGTPQLDRTIGRELDVVQAVYNHLQWLHAPRASRRR